MLPTIETLNQVSPVWIKLMWAVLWQSTLLAGLVAVIALLLRRSSPAARYWLWQIVAVKLVLMPFWTWSVPLPSWSKNIVTRPVFLTDPSPSKLLSQQDPPTQFENNLPAIPPDLDQSAGVRSRSSPRYLGWQTCLMSAWLAIIIFQLIRLLWQRIHLRRLLQLASWRNDKITTLLQTTAAALDLKRTPSICLTDVDCSPFVCGIRRPVLVLPQSLAASLNPSQLQQVLLHELAHVKRRDLLWGWIPELARLIYFFHPVAHWVSYRICLERELACDQLAMAHSGQDATEYARTLVEVVSHASEPAVLKASAGLVGADAMVKQK
jgi:beta-lactamase regulating signal transducer with metallopeptidase domain